MPLHAQRLRLLFAVTLAVPLAGLVACATADAPGSSVSASSLGGGSTSPFDGLVSALGDAGLLPGLAGSSGANGAFACGVLPNLVGGEIAALGNLNTLATALGGDAGIAGIPVVGSLPGVGNLPLADGLPNIGTSGIPDPGNLPIVGTILGTNASGGGSVPIVGAVPLPGLPLVGNLPEVTGLLPGLTGANGNPLPSGSAASCDSSQGGAGRASVFSLAAPGLGAIDPIDTCRVTETTSLSLIPIGANAGVGTATVTIDARTEADAAVTSLTIPLGLFSVKIDAATTKNILSCKGGDPTFESQTDTAGVTIAGHTFVSHGTPNEGVILPDGLGRLLFHEETRALKDRRATSSVAAIHIWLSGLAEIIVAEADAEIACACGANPKGARKVGEEGDLCVVAADCDQGLSCAGGRCHFQ